VQSFRGKDFKAKLASSIALASVKRPVVVVQKKAPFTKGSLSESKIARGSGLRYCKRTPSSPLPPFSERCPSSACLLPFFTFLCSFSDQLRSQYLDVLTQRSPEPESPSAPLCRSKVSFPGRTVSVHLTD